MKQQPPTSELIETWGSTINALLVQDGGSIPERCRTCPNSSSENLSSLHAAALEQEEGGKDTSALRSRAAKSYLRIISSIGQASRGICIRGVVKGELSLLIEDPSGREIHANAQFCGLNEKVQYGTPEYDELCRAYARVRKQYDQTVDEVTKRQLFNDELALEAQFPDDFPEVIIPEEAVSTEDGAERDRPEKLFDLAVGLITAPDGIIMTKSRVYLHGLSLLRKEAATDQQL